MANDQTPSSILEADLDQAPPSNAGDKAYHKDQVVEIEATTAPNTEMKGKEWRTASLHWSLMIGLVLIEAGMVTVIVYLDKRSASQNGIVSIAQFSTSLISSYFSISNIWEYGLLWTTLPSLIMTIYRMMWVTIVSAASDRQSFIELKRPQRGEPSADSTLRLELDHRAYPSIFAWIVALRNGHIHLGIPMLLSWALSIAIIPLAAHLFVAAPSQSGSTVPISFTTSFNERALTPLLSLQPALDLMTANRIYGANPPSWMTSEYAFEAFEVEALIRQTGNLTAETNAYSAQLDCQIFPPESSATYTDGGVGGLGGGVVHYNINDRGCDVSGVIAVGNTTSTIVKSWQSNCAGSEHGRIGIIGGTYSDESSIKLVNFSLVSCTIWYWNTSGSITVSSQDGLSPRFISFAPNTSISFHPFLYLQLETSLHSYGFFDVSNSIYTDAFGFSVYSCAQKQNAASPLMPDLIKNCTQDLFQTMYAGLATTILLQDKSITRAGTGELSTPVTRLYVVTPVAFTIVGVLTLALVFNIVLLVYTYTTTTILQEEPFVLVGKEELLNQRHDPQLIFGYWENRRPKLPYMNKVLCHNAATAVNRGENGQSQA